MFGSARPQHAKVALVVAALLAVTCLSGCDETTQEGSGGGKNPAANAVAEPSANQAAPAEIAWTAKLDVIGQPVEAGPALLVLSKASRGTVELVSLDAKTGRTNFRMPFHPGGMPAGMAMTPRATETDAGRHLAVLRRYDLDAAGPALVAVDVRTGAIVASTPTAVDDYDACSDGTDVCWSGFESRPGAMVEGPFGTFRDVIPGSAPSRWDLETGRVRESGQEGAQKIGSELYFAGEGRTSVVMRQKGTRIIWSQSTSLAVTSGADPRYGWNFNLDQDSNVYVGGLGRPFAPKLIKRFERGEKVELDYRSRYLTVGIDGRTGEQLWRRKGASAGCPLIPSVPAVEGRTLCVVGGASVNVKGREARDKGLAVELQGIDPRTGDVAWRHRLVGASAQSVYADGEAPLAPFGLVLPASDGAVALDMRSGDLQEVSDDTALLCTAGPDRVTVYGVPRLTGMPYRTCAPDGSDAPGPPSEFGVSAVEAEGGLRLVSMPGKVVAYRVD